MLDKQSLFEFVNSAAKATYAGGGTREKVSERPDFFELVYIQGEWSYRDSYTGHSRSGGQEIVRLNDKPVWWSGYGGGMVVGKENMANETFEFLKRALGQDEDGFYSLRGPHEFTESPWKYSYEQRGDITDFYGLEEIFYAGEKVFWHRAIGGIIDH